MSLQLVRLLQLASPTLPVGAYTYSQGLEWMVDTGVVSNEARCQQWLSSLLEHTVAAYEAPLLGALMRAWASENAGELQRLDEDFVASRESSELRAETLQMGYSLVRLLLELPAFTEHAALCACLRNFREPSFPLAWSAAAMAWRIPAGDALTAYLWAWLENQVMAAVKAVPLGQSAGQRLLSGIGARIPALAAQALACPEDLWSNYTPGFAHACACHETQYSRLFRS